jgi:hypothetical protein
VGSYNKPTAKTTADADPRLPLSFISETPVKQCLRLAAGKPHLINVINGYEQRRKKQQTDQTNKRLLNTELHSTAMFHTIPMSYLIVIDDAQRYAVGRHGPCCPDQQLVVWILNLKLKCLSSDHIYSRNHV